MAEWCDTARWCDIAGGHSGGTRVARACTSSASFIASKPPPDAAAVSNQLTACGNVECGKCVAAFCIGALQHALGQQRGEIYLHGCHQRLKVPVRCPILQVTRPYVGPAPRRGADGICLRDLLARLVRRSVKPLRNKYGELGAARSFFGNGLFAAQLRRCQRNLVLRNLVRG